MEKFAGLNWNLFDFPPFLLTYIICDIALRLSPAHLAWDEIDCCFFAKRYTQRNLSHI